MGPVLDIFEIKPDYDLNIMQARQTADITTRARKGCTKYLMKQNPILYWSMVIPQLPLGASLVAFIFKVKVGHVEAGLVTYDKYSPYPEEMNRKLTGSIG